MSVKPSLSTRLKRRFAWEIERWSLVWEVMVRSYWHDLVVNDRLKPRIGSLTEKKRVAIYAIYPSQGVQPSHLRALRHLSSCGYAPFLVSNLPLSEEDEKLLTPLVWRLMVRPNYGFDIGAYRAAILWIGGKLSDLERLVLVNDSIWFPVGRGADWLTVAGHIEQQAISSGTDIPSLIGAVTNYGIVPAPLGKEQSWVHDPGRPEFHYCSFALSFGPPILTDISFRAFWKKMRLTDHKIEAVHRGEVGLTQWVIARGHNHAFTWDIKGLPGRLRDLPYIRLCSLIDNLVIPEDASLRAARRGFAENLSVKNDPLEVINFLLTVIAHTGAAYALPRMMDEDGLGFVKKSPLRLDPEGRATTLAALDDDLELKSEAEALPFRGC